MADLVGTSTVTANLTTMVTEIERFYEASLPIAMSLFSDADLLSRHREAVRARGAGPEVITARMAEYLRGEQEAGRVSRAVGGRRGAGADRRLHAACVPELCRPAGRGSDLAGFAEAVVTAAMHGLVPA